MQYTVSQSSKLRFEKKENKYKEKKTATDRTRYKMERCCVCGSGINDGRNKHRNNNFTVSPCIFQFKYVQNTNTCTLFDISVTVHHVNK